MSSQRIPLVAVAVALLLTATVSLGDVPKTMNYQGQLLDAGGLPVADGPYEMTFAIYDDSTTGSPLWEQTFASVLVEEGLFSVVLGSSGNPIPDSAFAIGQTWMEIFVEGEKIEPRTQLTAMPYTFSAGSVKGDFTTEPGGITLEDAAKGGGYTQIRSHGTGNDMSMYMAEPTDEGRFSLYDWQGGNPQPMVEVEASPDLGSSIRLADPPDTGDRLALKTDATETSLKMVPPYDPEGLLEMKIDPDSGSIIRMADPPDTGDRLVLSANPVSGSSVCLTDPVYQTDFLALRGTESLGGSFELYNPSFGMPCDPIIWMGVESGPYYSGILRMREPAEQGYNRTLLEISTHVENGATIRMFNPQPEPPEEAALRLDIDALTFLDVECGGKGTWRTIYSKCGVAFDDTAGETLKVDVDLDRIPYESYYMADGLKAGALAVTETSVGIGVTDMNHALVVGKDLGAHSSLRAIVIGRDDPGTSAGVKFGEDENNYGRMVWSVDDDHVLFMTREAGTTYNPMFLKRERVGIGISDPAYLLDVNGIIQCDEVIQTSDSRLKSNVRRLADALEKLEQINGVMFEWNDIAGSHGSIPGRKDIGVIADEVERVLPELVYTDDRGYKSVAYTKLVPVLIEAVKDQQGTIDNLSSRVEELSALVQELLEDR